MTDSTTTTGAAQVETNEDTKAAATTAPAVDAKAADHAEENPWKKAGALIVAGGPKSMPANKEGRQVIVVENRTQLTSERIAEGDVDSADAKATYPKNAAVYIGHATVADTDGEEARRIFPDAGDAEVLLLGDNVKQFSHSGLSRKPGMLSVGPASAAYAAVNLALQRGATDVKIVGLRDDERTALRPWFEEISPEFESLEYGG